MERGHPTSSLDETPPTQLTLGGEPREDATITSAHRLLASFATSEHHAIMALDVTGRITVWNPGCERVFGYRASEARGQHISLLSPPGDASASRLLEEVLAGRRATVERRRVRQDGASIDVAITVAPVVGDDGSTVGVSAIVDDITERKAMERALRRSEQLYRGLLDHANGVVYRLQVHPEQRFEFVGAAVRDLTGFSPEEYYADPGLPIARAHPDDRRRLEATRSPRRPGAAILRTCHRDGHWVTMHDRFTPILDEEGRVVAVQGLLVDISAEVETRRALEEALAQQQAVNELQATFIQAVSHELRTPLTAVLGFAQTLAGNHAALTGEQVDELLARIVANGQRLEALLGDILDVDRFSRGIVVADRQPTDLVATCEQLLHDLPADGPVVTVGGSRELVSVDAAKVARAIDNLLRNACKHAVGATRVDVHVDVDRVTGAATVTVADDGPGVPDALKAAIFAPFRQGPQSASSASPGTGIGLALVAGVGALHGGRAWVEDQPGGGARFVLELAGAHPAADGSPGAG